MPDEGKSTRPPRRNLGQPRLSIRPSVSHAPPSDDILGGGARIELYGSSVQMGVSRPEQVPSRCPPTAVARPNDVTMAGAALSTDAASTLANLADEPPLWDLPEGVSGGTAQPVDIDDHLGAYGFMFEEFTGTVDDRQEDLLGFEDGALLDSDTSLYWYALQEAGAMYRLDVFIYVFQDWDEVNKELKLGRYYHVAYLPRGPGQFGIACTCSTWKARGDCLHKSVCARHISRLDGLPCIAPFPPPSAILFQATPFRDMYLFSCVSSTGLHASGKRTIVSYQRDGRWHCQSCAYGAGCKHIPHARLFALANSLIPDAEFRMPAEAHTSSIDAASALANEAENQLLLHAGTQSDGLSERGCVSHVPISPPRWCAWPSEEAYNAPKLNTGGREHFPINLETAQCCCGCRATDPLAARCPISIRHATIFGLTSRRDVTLELLPCPSCKHSRRQIDSGPDLGQYGLFNWNNVFLFEHDLLDAYTSAFTASETPFSAFCVTVRRAYLTHGRDNTFCSDETFVRVWFAFVRIQELDSGMTCPTCGPSPDVVIVDGISLGTHSSKLLATVRPPTMTDGSSERMETISSYRARCLPAIPEPALRATALRLIEEISGQPSPALPNLATFMSTYPAYASFLALISREGRTSEHYTAYRTFALQIAAPDIVLQLVPHETIAVLRSLSQYAAEPPLWLQCLCPALGTIVNSHRAAKSALPPEIRATAGWLADRAQDVYDRLALHDPAPANPDLPQRPWLVTGTHYGMRAIRERRAYPKLRYDAQPLDRDAEQMGDCNKFYKTYSKNNLTGGIFVFWCTHSICLGFHSIPVAEGRNDVFSAIYTRFPNAPAIVIYDFACQLAPYCFVREARYFRNTKFLIDEMHAHDHTKCGQACFASNSMRYDDRVRTTNTSAAECGNKGMKRIRKSISFMTYRHAVCFTKVFLDIWNRDIINRMRTD